MSDLVFARRAPRRAFAPRIAFVLLTSASVTAGQVTAAAASDTCATARVWASPRVVDYRDVLRDAQERGGKPNPTAFIELPDGSAGDIDLASVAVNGVPVLPEPSRVRDADGNHIPDLMVKIDWSALLTTEGRLDVTGRTRSGTCFAGETTVEIQWCPVHRSDYFIHFETSNMPDGDLNGLRARLDVHRVRPAGGCPTAAALVLVHGQTIPASAAFDLRYKDYSLMERLAMRGIDTFAANHLGLGFSSLPRRFNPLNDPCNASLPQCPLEKDGTCIPTEECDCRRGLADIYKTGQQVSTRYLNPNPLTAPCAHTSSTQFQIVTDQVEQLDLVVNDALAKTDLQKVYLLSLSLGGSTIGKYLGIDVSHQDKVGGAIFLASTFRGAVGIPSSTWPLGLIDKADAMANFNLAAPSCKAGDGCVSSGCTPVDPDCTKGLTGCPDQQDPGIQDPLWDAVEARDPVGPHWGPRPSGLSRYPVVPRFGWDDTVTSQIKVPALVMNGLKDSVARVPASVEIWSSSPLQDPEVACTSDADCAPDHACRPFLSGPAMCRLNNRILEQLDCASHALLWETCSGENCVDPHRTVQKRVGDWILTGK